MSRIFFSQKREKTFSDSQRLLAPLLFQERQGEVINVFAFIPFFFPQTRKNIFLAKTQKINQTAEQNFQDKRMSRIFFSQNAKTQKKLSRKGC
jgi:hypothetical protein